MKYEPIRASVSPETIGKVTRLFNGSLSDILNELLRTSPPAQRRQRHHDASKERFMITLDDNGAD